MYRYFIFIYIGTNLEGLVVKMSSLKNKDYPNMYNVYYIGYNIKSQSVMILYLLLRILDTDFSFFVYITYAA